MKKLHKYFCIFSVILLLMFITFYTIRGLYYKKKSSNNNKYSNILYNRILQQENNYSIITGLEKKSNTYYFTGKTKYNYITYKGLTWRIIKFNKNNTILILDKSITSLTYNQVYNWLNKDEDNDGIFEDLIENNISVHNLEKKNNNVDNFMHIKSKYCEYKYNKYTLLNKTDYEIIGNSDSFINNNTDFWITGKEYVDISGTINKDDNNYHGIRPIISIDSSINIKSGNGSIDSPYLVSTVKINKLEDIENNSYLKYNNSLWKVISHEKNKIKIISEECIKDEDKKCINIPFSNDNNKINKYNKKGVIYYLNNTYYNKIKNKKYIVKSKFYIGKYINNDYKTIYTDEIELYIGLPTIADPYSLELNNTYLLTTNENNISIYISQDEHPYETMISEKAFLRPVLYLKDNISIKKGNGTYEKPYELGGIINEE